MIPKYQPQHQRGANREGIKFGQDMESTFTADGGNRFHVGHERRSSRDDTDFHEQLEASSVTVSAETVGRQPGEPAEGQLSESAQGVAHGGIGPSPLKTTYGDASRRSAPGALNRENGTPECISGDSPYRNPGSGQSPLHPHAYQGRLGRKLGSASPAWEKRTSDGTAFVSGAPGRTRPDKGPPLPKFGEWDANNPASGDGFTMIFDKARDEKKTGGAVRIPALQPEPATEVDFHKSKNSSQESSWFSCCFH